MSSTANLTVRDAQRLRPDQWTFLTACAALPLMQWGAWAGAWVYGADGLMVVAGVLWVAAILRRQTTLRFGTFSVVVSAYVAVCVLSAMFSADPRASFLKLPIDVYVCGLAVLACNEIDSEQILRRWLWAWLMGTAIAAAAGLWGVVAFYGGRESAFVGGYGSLPAGDYPRVVGTFLNFNMLCNYLSAGVLLALGAKKAGWVRGTIAWPIAVAASVAAAFTVSPGLGGLLLGLSLWMWANDREKWTTAVGWLLSGIAAAIAFFMVTMVSPSNFAEPSSRLLCWEEAAGMVKAHPLLGAGTGVPVACPGWANAAGGVQHLKDAHNLYLNIAAQKGLFGLAAFLSIAWLLLRGVRLREEGSGTNVLAVVLAIAVIEAVLYQGLSSSFEHTRHLWVLMGVLAAVREIQQEPVLNDGSLHGSSV